MNRRSRTIFVCLAASVIIGLTLMAMDHFNFNGIHSTTMFGYVFLTYNFLLLAYMKAAYHIALPGDPAIVYGIAFFQICLNSILLIYIVNAINSRLQKNKTENIGNEQPIGNA